MSTSSALAALHEFEAPPRPYATYAFLAACFLVTVPSLLYTPLYGMLGGIEPRTYPWQPFTAVFEHGWPGFHGSIHLALNTFLILECGRPCERLLGSGRFVLLCVGAMTANAVSQAFTEGANGSSLVIWSWGPPLFLCMRWAKVHAPEAVHSASYQRIRTVLILMYGVITALMGLLPLLSGWRGNPLAGVLRGNLYHLVATMVGIAFAWFWSERIRKRMSEPNRGETAESMNGRTRP